jgi:hypothetical protein
VPAFILVRLKKLFIIFAFLIFAHLIRNGSQLFAWLRHERILRDVRCRSTPSRCGAPRLLPHTGGNVTPTPIPDRICNRYVGFAVSLLKLHDRSRCVSRNVSEPDKNARLRSRVYHFPLSTTNNGIITRLVSHMAGQRAAKCRDAT